MPAGTRVRHETFGQGVVDKWVDQRVVRVSFDNGDTRMLVVAQAPLTVIDQSRSQ